MIPRSLSSSPDLLGPAGDADFLISSPVPSFDGRQSWIPSSDSYTSRKRPRSTLSPAKATHIIRFDDLVLPSSPPLRVGGQRRSLSPTKIQSEGNLSPWRIRVTVEAEHEDEAHTGKKPRKTPKAAATTIKVPLKDGGQRVSSPKKPRGRSRKSDNHDPDAILSRGSPGRTPKRKSLGGKIGQDRLKEAPGTVKTGNSVQLARSNQGGRSPLDEANRYGNSRFKGANSSPDPFGDDIGAGRLVTARSSRILSAPSKQADNQHFETPVKTVERIIGGDPELTPESAVQQFHQVSPNTLHAGHTPRPRRLYPSPTSSSLLGEENLDQGGSKPLDQNGRSADNSSKAALVALGDPTEQHQEFDSIMESEGFSMVSLKTLPSAKQRGFGTILNSSKGPLKPFLEQQQQQHNRGSSNKAKLRAPNVQSQHIQDSTSSSLGNMKPVGGISGVVSHPHRMKEPAKKNARVLPTKNERSSAGTTLEPANLPGANTNSAPVAQAAQAASKEKKSFPSLARVVRAGIALQGILRRQQSVSKLKSPFSSPGRSAVVEETEDQDNPRKRLEILFSSFGLETQRELRAGIRFGEKLARQRMESERRTRGESNPQVMKSVDVMAPGVVERVRSQDAMTGHDRTESREPSPGMKRRLEEWQREREIVSKQIQAASPSQVVVIDSDVDDSLQGSDGSEVAPEFDEQLHPEEDDYEDIWQLEARDYKNNLNSYSVAAQRQGVNLTGRPHNVASSVQNPSADVDPTVSIENIPPSLSRVKQRESLFAGKSQPRQLKEEQVDLATLLNTEETPSTKRYYGDSTPHATFIRNYAYASDEVVAKSRHHEPGPSRNLSSTNLSQLAREVDLREQDIQSTEVVNLSSPLPPPSMSGEEGDYDDEVNGIYEVQHSDDGLKDHEQNLSPSILPGEAPIREGPTIISQVGHPVRPEATASSPFLRQLTDIAPEWLSKTNAKTIGSFGPLAEQVRLGGLEEQSEDIEDPRQVIGQGVDRFRPSQISSQNRSRKAERQPKEPAQAIGLGTSGYFTDDHYVVLRHLYRLAKQSSDLFPYYPTPRRDEMIGDWLWTADNVHGVPVTEIQFGILDVFMQQLSEGDRRNGGTGEIGWTEDDLHRRLFSVIVGEQIRRERRMRPQRGAVRRERFN